MTGQPRKRFSDFAKERKLIEGDKIRIDDVLNKEITVLDFHVRDSKYTKTNCSKCLTVQVLVEGKKCVIFTGSNILIDQIERYKAELPYLTTIKKIDRYYTFT